MSSAQIFVLYAASAIGLILLELSGFYTGNKKQK
jgi:hypothetical protein